VSIELFREERIRFEKTLENIKTNPSPFTAIQKIKDFIDQSDFEPLSDDSEVS
jgi:hypothetical protein